MARLRNKRAGFNLLIPLYWNSVLADSPLRIQALDRCERVEERPDLMPSAARAVQQTL